MALWDLPAGVWTVARKVENLLTLQASMARALADIDARLQAMEDRMTHLEAGQGQLVTEARAAAGAAATGLAGSVISEVVTRVTRIEMRQEDMLQRLMPPGV